MNNQFFCLISPSKYYKYLYAINDYYWLFWNIALFIVLFSSFILCLKNIKVIIFILSLILSWMVAVHSFSLLIGAWNAHKQHKVIWSASSKHTIKSQYHCSTFFCISEPESLNQIHKNIFVAHKLLLINAFSHKEFCAS